MTHDWWIENISLQLEYEQLFIIYSIFTHRWGGMGLLGEMGCRASIVLPVLLAVSLSSCGEDARNSGSDPMLRAEDGSCYLEQFSLANDVAPDRPVSRSPAMDIYVDVSGSMPGYGSPELVDGYTTLPYRSLIGALLDFPDIETFGFANEIGEATPVSLAQLARGVPGACPTCGRTETHLNSLFRHIAENRSSGVAAVVTDLWLANTDILGNGARTYIDPIEAILASGQAIGVVGIRAPYQGPIYDMPDGGSFNGAYQYRPIFVLLVGEPGEVTQIFEDVQRGVLIDEAPENWSYTLYTSDLVAPGRPSRLRFEPMPGIAGRERLINFEGVEDQFRIDGRALDRAGREASTSGTDVSAGISIGFDPTGLSYPESALQPQVVYETRSEGLAETSLACHATAWFPALEGTDTVTVSGTQPVYDIGRGELQALPRGLLYGVRFQIRSGAGHLDPQEDAWLESWSFSAVAAPEIRATDPEFFPVLNLTQFRRVLRDATLRSVVDEPIADGAFFYTVE